MSRDDQTQWDARYRGEGPAPVLDPPPPPPLFSGSQDLFPSEGTALELACGRGRAAVWLARRGIEYRGVDVSPEAIRLARELAAQTGVADRCWFEVHDLDAGLPDGDSVDLVFSYLFFDRDLTSAMVDRLVPGGMLAIATLSEVGAEPGPYRARPGELSDLFGSLDVLAEAEDDGSAWLIGRTPA